MFEMITVRSISAFAVVRVDYAPVAISNVSFYSGLFLEQDGLPNPNGALSSKLPSRSIALANKEAVSVLLQNGQSVKCLRGSYLQPVSELTAL